MSNPTPTPTITIDRDYDGYFERLVRSWVDQKQQSGQPFKHGNIVVDAGPYRSAALHYHIKDGVLHLDFYSAIRNGFGGIPDEDIPRILELL